MSRSAQLLQSQKMEAIGQLTGGIAHDFNNLLAVILGNLDFLSDKAGSNSPLQEYIQPAISAALHGAELTNQLLAFSRSQALQPQVILPNELVTRFSTLVQRTIGARIQLVMALSPHVWPVYADPSQLESVLLNLSVNARDAMPGGGKIIYETSNVELDEGYAAQHAEVGPGDYVLISVTDTGSGMSQDVIERAFEPFFTTKDIGKGSGMGLSMVYGFVKQSDGHVKIYSEVGHGTTIKLYLRRAAEGHPAPVAPTEQQQQQAALSDKPRLVLIVEDSTDVLKLTSGMVKSLGYEVITASSGDAAMAILKTRDDIDLLLTDVMLPGSLNGPAMAKWARQLHPQLKVLFNSGYAEHAIVETGLLEPGVHLIGKPFRKPQLAQKIAEVLGN